jgi:hypothetical protein
MVKRKSRATADSLTHLRRLPRPRTRDFAGQALRRWLPPLTVSRVTPDWYSCIACAEQQFAAHRDTHPTEDHVTNCVTPNDEQAEAVSDVSATIIPQRSFAFQSLDFLLENTYSGCARFVSGCATSPHIQLLIHFAHMFFSWSTSAVPLVRTLSESLSNPPPPPLPPSQRDLSSPSACTAAII